MESALTIVMENHTTTADVFCLLQCTTKHMKQIGDTIMVREVLDFIADVKKNKYEFAPICAYEAALEIAYIRRDYRIMSALLKYREKLDVPVDHIKRIIQCIVYKAAVDLKALQIIATYHKEYVANMSNQVIVFCQSHIPQQAFPLFHERLNSFFAMISIKA